VLWFPTSCGWLVNAVAVSKQNTSIMFWTELLQPLLSIELFHGDRDTRRNYTLSCSPVSCCCMWNSEMQMQVLFILFFRLLLVIQRTWTLRPTASNVWSSWHTLDNNSTPVFK
jgi:hypothetical protein